MKYGRRGEGFLYQTPDGHWHSVLCVRGKQREFTANPPVTDEKLARLFHQGKLDEMAAERLGRGELQTAGQQRLLFGSLLDDRIKDYQINGGKSLWSFLAHARPVRAHFGTCRAADIKKRDVDAYVLKRQRGGKARGKGQLTAGGINREIGIITSTLRLAVTNELLPKVPPGIKRLPETNIRRGFFEQAEIEAVIAHLPEYAKDFTRFGYLVGWRYSEIANLKWTAVNLDERTITLPNSKNGQGRVIALDGELWALVQRRLAARLLPTLLDRIKVADLVFHRTGRNLGRIDECWGTACRKAGVPGRLFHDLRRTAARNMIRRGIPQVVAMQITGHKTEKMFRRYNIVDLQDLRSAAKKLSLVRTDG